MTKFIDLTLNGISTGAIYAAVALALVLIWRSTRIVNFAQGGMLMFTTFLGWTVLPGSPWLWTAFALAVPGLPILQLVLGSVVSAIRGRSLRGSSRPSSSWP